jgi:hypothetical protein
MPDINTDPASSNIYGISERILLTWLNYSFSNYREQVWTNREQCKERKKIYRKFSLIKILVEVKSIAFFSRLL